jgi:hypothetical protein
MKNSFANYLYKKGFVREKDNVIYAQDAFKINSIIQWCIKEKDPKKLKKYAHLIGDYFSGSIDIAVENDKLIVNDLRGKQ